MRILFIHQNFPGQFRHLAAALKSAGHDVRALGMQGGSLPGVPLVKHQPRPPERPPAAAWQREFDSKVLRGASALGAMVSLDQQGWRPDVVVAHPSWGEALFVKDLWPAVRLLCYLEFFYAPEGRDVGFDPEFGKPDLGARSQLRLKNTVHLHALAAMDRGLSPTRWQRDSFPALAHPEIDVVFDGIDTERVRPNEQVSAMLQAASGRTHRVRAGDEVITFVARNLEPYRGYHRFMRALPGILAARPQAVAILVGGNGVSYGLPAPNGLSWRDVYLQEVRDRLDTDRVFFVGAVDYERYLRLLQLSACHVYLTYPFVLSWSCVEALSAGCLVIGSNTPPVAEFIDTGDNGILVDFFDTEDLTERVVDALANPYRYRAMRARARSRAQAQHDLRTQCLPAQKALIDRLMDG